LSSPRISHFEVKRNKNIDNLFVFVDVYKSIYQIHSEPRSYTFAPEAKVLYQEFSDEIVQQMNKQLQEDVIVEDNMSKDRKIFVRYFVYMYML
jgi:hypothetical protein